MQDGIDQPERYTWRTLLQAIAVGIVGLVVTILVLGRFASPQVTGVGACGVFLSAVWFWTPQTRRRRYWPGFLLTSAVSAGIWVLLWYLVS